MSWSFLPRSLRGQVTDRQAGEEGGSVTGLGGSDDLVMIPQIGGSV